VVDARKEEHDKATKSLEQAYDGRSKYNNLDPLTKEQREKLKKLYDISKLERDD
jgi:hypothetical protein